MREILFRAKDKRDDRWRYGGVYWAYSHDRKIYVVNDYVYIHEVQKDTLGQYTGLDDIDGKNVYDGDILEAKLDDESEHVTRVVVEWGGFGWQTHQPGCDPDDMTEDDIGIWKVVGNKWDNPELLEYADEDTAQYADMPVLMPAT